MRTVLLFAMCLWGGILPLHAQKSPADSLLNLAIDRTKAGDVSGATAFYLEVEKMAEQAGDNRMLCRISIGMGKLGLIGENNQATEEAILKSRKYCALCKDTVNIARNLLMEGILSIKKNQMDTAFSRFKQSAETFMLAKDTMGAANSIAKLGNVLEVQGYYQEANAYYLQFYKAAISSADEIRIITANIYLTGNYLYLHQADKARFYNDQVIVLARKLGSNFEYAEALRYDAMIYAQLGKPAEAYQKLLSYTKYYQDTLMNEQRMKETDQLRTKYETEKKESLIALQQEELKRQQFRFWAILAFLGVALIIGVVLFLLTKRLRQRNREKEFLIKEIHHRVKNNLQILSSLLHLQSRAITDEAALDAVRAGQNRVDAMGLIHQKLYMGEHLARVEMKDYLEELGHNMLDTFGIHNDRVQIAYEVEPTYLDVDTAIPLGLIFNELLTNSLKYAFPGERQGVIRIALWKDAQHKMCLRVSDNGVGQNVVSDKGTGFGSNLIRILSKKMKGKVDILSGSEGYSTQIVFEGVELP